MKLRKDLWFVDFAYMGDTESIPNKVNILIFITRLLLSCVIIITILPLVIFVETLEWGEKLKVTDFFTIRLLDNDDVENDLED